MLAEPRNKQKWSADPRNTHWASDKSKFGYQMMSRMGWSEGKGLGAKENGNVTHVKVSKKNNNLGVGAKVSNEDNWLAHQDDFNSLLDSLNKNNGSDAASGDNKVKSLEATVKKSKKKIFYGKFLRSKDLSRATTDDMNSILGNRVKSAPSTPQNGSEDEDGNDSENSTASCPESKPVIMSGFVTSTSSYSMKDYFAEKMAKRNSSSNPSSPIIIDDDVAENSDTPLIIEDEDFEEKDTKKSKKSKKSKRRLDINEDEVKSTSKKSRKDKTSNDCEIIESTSCIVDDEQDNTSIRKKKKKAKKQKKSSRE